MRLFAVTILVAVVAATTGCAFKATDEECSQACENIARVSLEEVDRQIDEAEDLAQSGEGGKAMARNMAGAMVDAIKDECSKQCSEKGTRKQAECLARVNTAAELESCL